MAPAIRRRTPTVRARQSAKDNKLRRARLAAVNITWNGLGSRKKKPAPVTDERVYLQGKRMRTILRHNKRLEAIEEKERNAAAASRGASGPAAVVNVHGTVVLDLSVRAERLSPLQLLNYGYRGHGVKTEINQNSHGVKTEINQNSHGASKETVEDSSYDPDLLLFPLDDNPLEDHDDAVVDCMMGCLSLEDPLEMEPSKEALEAVYEEDLETYLFRHLAEAGVLEDEISDAVPGDAPRPPNTVRKLFEDFLTLQIQNSAPPCTVLDPDAEGPGTSNANGITLQQVPPNASSAEASLPTASTPRNPFRSADPLPTAAAGARNRDAAPSPWISTYLEYSDALPPLSYFTEMLPKEAESFSEVCRRELGDGYEAQIRVSLSAYITEISESASVDAARSISETERNQRKRKWKSEKYIE